jgi:hypothetical protein
MARKMRGRSRFGHHTVGGKLEDVDHYAPRRHSHLYPFRPPRHTSRLTQARSYRICEFIHRVVVHIDQIPSVSTGEQVYATVRDRRMGEIQLAGTLPNENAMLYIIPARPLTRYPLSP